MSQTILEKIKGRFNRLSKSVALTGKLPCGAEVISTHAERGVVRCPCFNNPLGAALSAETERMTKCSDLRDYIRARKEANAGNNQKGG